MDDLRKALGEVRGHLQELENSQKMTVREVDGVKGEVGALSTTVQDLSTTVQDLSTTVQHLSTTVQRMDQRLDGLRESVVLGHAATAALGGTFASIEHIMEQGLAEGATFRQQLSDLTRRVEALEKKAGG